MLVEEEEEEEEEGVPACWQSFILLRNMGCLFLKVLLPWGEM